VKALLRRVLQVGIVTTLAATCAVAAQAKAIESGSWTAAPNLLDGHVAHTATLLNDGRVLIASGFGVGSPTTVCIFSAVPGISRPSGYPPLLLAAAAGVLLTLLIIVGLVASSGRLSRRPAGTTRVDDSKWIDP
jgi:hypothetical protein